MVSRGWGVGSALTRALLRLVLPAIVVAAFADTPCVFVQSARSAPAATSAPADAGAAAKVATETSEPQVNTADILKRLNQDLGLNLNATTATWQHDFDRVESDLRRPGLQYSRLNALRAELRQVRAKVDDVSGRLQPRLNATNTQLNLLGPAPAAGQPVPEQIAASRAELNYRLGLLSAGQAAVNSARLRIEHLLNAIEDIRRQEFASFLLRPIPGIYAYDTWANLPDYVPPATDRLHSMISNWWNGGGYSADVGRIGLEAALLFVVLCFAGWRGVRRLRHWRDDGEPPFWRRASAAAGVVLLRALPVALPVMFAYGMLAAAQPLPEQLDWLFYLTAQSILIVFTVGALVITAFAPRAPRWRLIPASDAGAARICGLIIALAFVYSLTTLLYAITRLVQAPFALTIAVALPSSLLLAGLVVAILRTPLCAEDAAAPSMRVLRAIRSLVWIVAGAIVICALTGYLPLARFLAQQLVVTGSILALVYLLLLWVDGFAQSFSDDGAFAGHWLRQRANLERRRREQLALPIKLLLKLAVLVLSVPLIMLQWHYNWPDIEEWYRQLFFGFHIGDTQVTFGALLASLIVFGLGYATARLVQGWLDAQVLQQAGISGGVRNSIRTGVGYVGILIAALAAFSYAGFNLSSLAIVAGAFSIGIGFGLQNLVNNFLSGLIMLVERPIRVGDLVVVDGEEGVVRRISVRSTEIETGDGANVVIPNSSFISAKVKNWTLRNTIRRLTISVGTAYDCDPRQVRDLLLKIAHDNPDVLRIPEPVVDLKEFGALSLNFALYVSIDNINKTVKIRTDLSIAILAAFAEAGIDIPFPQTDISIRNLDRLREATAGSAARAADRGAASGIRRFTTIPAAVD
jgi:small-conductance mechanosensitive channel